MYHRGPGQVSQRPLYNSKRTSWNRLPNDRSIRIADIGENQVNDNFRPTPAAHTWFAVGLLYCGKQTLAERRYSTTWKQRLKRVFGIDIETCPAGGGADHRLHRRPSGDQEDSQPPRELKRFRGTLPVAARPGATAGGLVWLNDRLPPAPTNGCDLDGRGRAALGLRVRILAKIAFACGQFRASGGWDSGRYRLEGGLTAA